MLLQKKNSVKKISWKKIKFAGIVETLKGGDNNTVGELSRLGISMEDLSMVNEKKVKKKINPVKPQKGFYLLKLIFIVFIFLFSCSYSPIFAADIQTNTFDPSYGLQKPIKLAYCNYMPFYFEDLNKNPRGILVDIWKQWSLKTGIPVLFQLMPWDDVLLNVEKGTIDINCLMFKTTKREKKFDFSQSFFDLTAFLYYRTDSKIKVSGLDDLVKLKTGVVTKDYTVGFLKKNCAGLVPKEFSDHEHLVRAAINGQIEAFIMEGPVASTYIAKHDGSNTIKRLADPLYKKPLFAGVKKGNTALVDTINRGLSALSQDDIHQIVQTWTGAATDIVRQPYTKKVKIVAGLDNTPFHFADETGRAVGMFIDLWRLWSKKTGIDVDFVAVPWAQSLAMVKTGKADIHAGCFFSVQRDTYLDYSSVLRNCETHFFFHDSIFGLKNLEDLRGFKIGVLDQDYAVEFINRELPDTALKIYNSHRDLFEGVEKGEIRVFVCDTPTALFFLREKKLLSTFRYHPAHPLYRKPFYAAVREGNAALLHQVNKGLLAITKEERAAIERQWMGMSDIKSDNVLVIAGANNFPPFSMLSAEGKPSGLFIDMWELWSKKTGRPVVFKLYERAEAVNALKDGIADILSVLPPEKMATGWMDYATPYYRFDWHLYQGTDSAGSDTGSVDTQQTLGVVKDTRVEEWASTNMPDTRLIKYEATRQMILAAAEGKIHRFIALPQEMEIIPGRLGLPGLFKSSRQAPLVSQNVGAAVRTHNPDLIWTIENGFEAISTIERVNIEKRWIGEKNIRIFAPHNEQIFLTPAEKKWMTRHHQSGQKIRLGVNPGWPPFEFIEGADTYMGMVSDYVTLLNQRLGVNMIVERVVDLSKITRELDPLTRKIDVLPSAISFEAKSPFTTDTRPYLSFPWVIVNKRQAQLIGGLRDLYGKTVAIVDQYAIKERIKKDHPKIIILPVTSAADGLKSVTMGNADAYVGNLAVVGYQLQEKNDTSLKVAAATEYEDSNLAFAVRNDWPELVSILNKGIASISEQEHDVIRQKWFSVRFEHGITVAYIRELILKAVLGLVLVFGLFLFWNRQLKRREERFRCLTEHGTDLIQAFLPDGSIIYQSPSFTTMLGYRHQALVGTSVFALLHPSERQTWKEMIARLLTKESSESVVHRFCHTNGNYLFFESNCINLTRNKALKAIVVNGRDITERLHAQEQMQKAKELAEKASLTKSDFLANLSHEVRTPLNGILGMTNVTLQTPLTRHQKKNLITVKDSASHLLGVITDILDFSTIEAGKMRIQAQAFDLTALLSGLELTWAFQAREKGLAFSLVKDSNTPDYAISDPVRLRQILGNLISNAIKFTRKGNIQVRVTQAQKKVSNMFYLCFTIKDTGIGIEPDRLENIFERFTQVQTSITREYGGAGLGLTICREVAKLMGGTLSVDSTPGKGSLFSLKIPFKTARAADIPEPEPVMGSLMPESGNGLTLLLVEDDKMNARVFKEFLSTTPHTIIHSLDGIDSIEQLKRHTIDMVFMDIEMPRLDGLSACHSIRRGDCGDKNKSIPVIAMTAHVLDEFKEKSKQAGMDDFIPKPVDMHQLFKMIEKYRPDTDRLVEPIDPDETTDPFILDTNKALASLGGNKQLL
ncbi:MAG: transporter substrate-binding domain-containing protein, partial [Proteobacteria bacterium]|nr:transporter substrate-binding domain-containing protein [Pseudomonadota bacterium]